jgi:hypothetical protein
MTSLQWSDVLSDLRASLTGRLVGLWDAVSDESAFNSLTVDKQQALFLLEERLKAKGLWHVVKKIENVYGEGGVGIGFVAEFNTRSTLEEHKDFTRFMANHKDTTGGFYEKGRADAVLHFLYVEGNPQKWYVHFDLYSPVHSLSSAIKHFRYEFIGKLTPDWRMIQERLRG